ncbi:MAG TPA: PIG-L family deacetylase [Candidatus Sulfomarinibacteraceae bacterium]|nr:PIG-L family deacetylase [Candidatus Sulfomarinibacteraceae bacterium]
MPQQLTLLAVYAHPDDEILGAGGSLARYAAEGVRTAVIVATRGEAGEIQRPGTATPETLSQVREQEMRCSAEALGVSELIFLDYRDSGMAGAPENEHPDAFVNAPAHEVVERLVRVIRRLQPQVVLTFEPYGGYGHPDHIAVNRYTLAAVDAAADPARYQGQGPAWRTERVYYPIIPNFLIDNIKARVAARGGDVSGYDELLEGRAANARLLDDEICVKVDISGFVDDKWRAWNCHRTQFGPNSRFRRLPDEEMKPLLSTEYFVQARPRSAAPPQLDDLFAYETTGDPSG